MTKQDIIWQEEQPVRPICPKNRLLCLGAWTKLEGEKGKTGWFWACGQHNCRYAIKALGS